MVTFLGCRSISRSPRVREAGPAGPDRGLLPPPEPPQAWRGTLARRYCRRLRAVYTIMRWFRRHKVRAHLTELQRQFQTARQPPHYGRDLVWPQPPAVLQPFQDICQALFCRYSPSATTPSLLPTRLEPTEPWNQVIRTPWCQLGDTWSRCIRRKTGLRGSADCPHPTAGGRFLMTPARCWTLEGCRPLFPC